MYSAYEGIHMPPVISYIVGVMCSLSGETLAEMPSWCSKDPVTPEPSLVKGECQWQEIGRAHV